MKHLKLWKEPDNYLGETYFEYYPLVGQSRDSSVLEKANFKAFTELLGGESEFVIIARAGHWAAGWIETLMIHKDSPKKLLELADKALEDISDYPVLDEELLSEMEYEYATEVWNNCFDLEEKVELCQEYNISVFAARHDYIPQDDNGMLFEYLITP